MCLITKECCTKTTTKDIVVFKIVNIIDDKIYSALYGNFLYERNKIYETKFSFTNDGMFPRADPMDKIVIDKYAPNINQGKILSDYLVDRYTCVGEGFHSAKTKERLIDLNNKISMNTEILKFIIPKGSEYYEDETDLIVSNKILLNF